jgi:hypothetical protein
VSAVLASLAKGILVTSGFLLSGTLGAALFFFAVMFYMISLSDREAMNAGEQFGAFGLACFGGLVGFFFGIFAALFICAKWMSSAPTSKLSTEARS